MSRDPYADVVNKLEAERQVPRPTFRASLRRRLAAMEEAGVGKPAHLGLLIAIHAGLGTALLGAALLGALGSGPLSAG